jgi:hypothetical protein
MTYAFAPYASYSSAASGIPATPIGSHSCISTSRTRTRFSRDWYLFLPCVIQRHSSPYLFSSSLFSLPLMSPSISATSRATALKNIAEVAIKYPPPNQDEWDWASSGIAGRISRTPASAKPKYPKKENGLWSGQKSCKWHHWFLVNIIALRIPHWGLVLLAVPYRAGSVAVPASLPRSCQAHRVRFRPA